MNKPATKEPSMDEILSSIRQIIADDDAAGAPRRPAIQAAPPPMQATPVRPLVSQAERDLSDMLDDIEPLALSPSQIVADHEEPEAAGGGFSFESLLADAEDEVQPEEEEENEPAPHLVEAEDVAFLADEVEEDEADEELPSFNPTSFAAPEPPPVPRLVTPAPQPEPAPAPRFHAPPRPQPSIAQAAPLPDPTLTRDMADQLLEPTTQAAVKASMTRLNGIGLGNGGATIESLMRDMLRPMLKEWLDENLPSVVERMVEKEIARISRGD